MNLASDTRQADEKFNGNRILESYPYEAIIAEANPGEILPTVSPAILRKLQRDSRTGARKLYQVLCAGTKSKKKRKTVWTRCFISSDCCGKREFSISPEWMKLASVRLPVRLLRLPLCFRPAPRSTGSTTRRRLMKKRGAGSTGKSGRKPRLLLSVLSKSTRLIGINIYHAGIQAMRVALSSLPVTPQHILVDSRTVPGFTQPQNSFDKGDGINFSIAAASIVAKVYRDGLMTDLDKEYPGYGFASHKGYATPEHQRAIREFGPCPIHRRSFDYIRELCGQYCELYYSLKSRDTRLRRAMISRDGSPP